MLPTLTEAHPASSKGSIMRTEGARREGFKPSEFARIKAEVHEKR
jgi:hypothetical protein